MNRLILVKPLFILKNLYFPFQDYKGGWSGIWTFVIILGLVGWSERAAAQCPTYYNTGVDHTAGRSVPFNFNSQKAQFIYAPADLNTISRSGYITKIYFRSVNGGEAGTFNNFKISFTQTINTNFQNNNFYTGLTVVHSQNLQTITGSSSNFGWFEIPLSAPYFQYDSTRSLIVEIQYSSKTGGMETKSSESNGVQKILYSSNLTATTGTNSTTFKDFGFDIAPTLTCTIPPVAGIATTLNPSVCAGSNFKLYVCGASSNPNQTYQWETSSNGSTGWTPIGPSSSNSTFTTSQSAGSHYYRAAVTCSGLTAYSTVLMVTARGAASGGSFTINDKAPPSATNFQSFTAAINHISCGISGPVTLTVVPGSGPYPEQIEFPEISGTSPINTITIQGNNCAVNPITASNNPAIIRLNGTDYVTVNNLHFIAAGSGWGWGIQLLNGADHNTFADNTISLTLQSTNPDGTVGIVFSNSTTSANTAGNTGNNNLFTRNHIHGGTTGVLVNGSVNSPGNNRIIDNTITEFFSTAVALQDANNTLVENNRMTRPNRTAVGTFIGVSLSGATQNSTVNKNSMSSTHSGAPIYIATSAYGVYSNMNDAPAGSENIIKNNLFHRPYNIGPVYALYNNNSDGVYYYHNTIRIDTNPNGSVRGFYQTGQATNIKVINNIFHIRTGGTANVQHGIYFGTPASNIESNNNNIYVPTGHVGYYSTNKTTLADWQAANPGAPFDLNSVSVNPLFPKSASAPIAPTNFAMNNIGQPVPNNGTDRAGVNRDPIAPDPGGYEFNPSNLDIGVNALIAPVFKNCYGSSEPITVAVKNFGAGSIDLGMNIIKVMVTVTGAASPNPFVVTLTESMNNGQPLAAGATMNVVVGNVNLTSNGTYNFNSSVTVTDGGIDVNLNNNSLSDTIAVNTLPLTAGLAEASHDTICTSGKTTLTLTGHTGGAVQWTRATNPAGPFTNISGATSSSYTLPTAITQTTYYRAIAICGTNTANSNTVTVTVVNPAITASSGGISCGGSPVTLSATASPGTSVNWYTSATGGIPIATGPSFIPSITATTTYYAAAALRNSNYNVGPASNTIGPTTGSSTSGYNQIFDVLAPLNLQSVYVYPTAAGNVRLFLSNNAGTILQVFTVPVTASDVNNKTLIPLNYFLPVGTGYRLGWYTGGVNLLANSAGASYPYTIQNVISVTGTTYPSGASRWFAAYDWQVTVGCESSRTAVVATFGLVPATPSISASGPTTLCNGSSVVLIANSNTPGATYQWYNNGTAIAGATSATFTANASGSYSVDANASGCQSGQSPATIITVNPLPTTPTITLATGSTTAICQGSSAVLTGTPAGAGATYTWALNGTPITGATGGTYNAAIAGIYTLTVTTPSGCTATSTGISITVNPLPATPAITQNGGTLTSSSTSGNQWFLNGSAIPGATAQNYVTTANGNYTVTVTANGCSSAPSTVRNVTNTGIENTLPGMSVEIFPNPATGSFNIKLNGYQQDATLALYSLTGQQIFKTSVPSDGKPKNIDTRGLATGTYLLKVTSEKGIQVKRLIINN